MVYKNAHRAKGNKDDENLIKTVVSGKTANKFNLSLSSYWIYLMTDFLTYKQCSDWKLKIKELLVESIYLSTVAIIC